MNGTERYWRATAAASYKLARVEHARMIRALSGPIVGNGYVPACFAYHIHLCRARSEAWYVREHCAGAGPRKVNAPYTGIDA